MNIAIASGKGGTGKTTVAVNLAVLLGERGVEVAYVDCDVEEPNGHLFLKPSIERSAPAKVSVPVIDESKCDACGECVRFCRYRALARLGKNVILFPELCHGCDGCSLICPAGAISRGDREIGHVEIGRAQGMRFVHGRLNIGEAMSPPLIRQVLHHATGMRHSILDSPPGTSCPVIASLHRADFVVLVTEPTPFGLNDLGLAIDMVVRLGLPFGVVINRADPERDDAERFCAERRARILATIPDDRRIAEAYSRGELIVKTVPSVEKSFTTLWNSIVERAGT